MGNLCGFGVPGRYILAKLKFLKEYFRKWRKEICIREIGSIKLLKEKVESQDIMAESSLLSSGEHNSRMESMTKIREIEQAAKLDLEQNAKIKWIYEGMKIQDSFTGR